jgi:four helix bundle protein
MFKFENLLVWQKAIEYTDLVYTVSDSFPSRENYGLCRQLQRAAVSVPSNIAEGNGRSSPVEYARFVEIAYGSLMESVTQLHTARRRNYCSDQQFTDLSSLATEVARLLSGLRRSLLYKDHKDNT